MPLETLAVIAALFAGHTEPAGLPATRGDAPLVVELGLMSPLEKLEDVDAFSRRLAERLVWTLREDDPDPETGRVPIRFSAIRIERGRVTANYRSDIHEASGGLESIAELLGPEGFAAFRDVCLSSEDPPAAVRAVSGSSHLDAEGLERAIAGAARTRDLASQFDLDEPLNLEWGRHVVLVLAASSEEPALRVRPLILVLERK